MIQSQYLDSIVKSTNRGKDIIVNFELFNSLDIEDRKVLNDVLKKQQLNKLTFQGSTTIQEIKQHIEQYTNNTKIILMCERFVPNPFDTIGDILSTVQKQELTFQICTQVVTG